MQKILLQGTNLTEVREVKDYLEAKLPYKINVSMSEKDSLSHIHSKPVHLYLLSLEKFDLDDTQWIKQVRSEGFEQPVLVLSSNIDQGAMRASSKADKVHFLEKPFEYTSLKGLVLKLIKQRQLPQQQFKRFRTNQRMAVESYATGEVIESNLFNLSVGGAYFESSNKCRASVGDLLKMSVSLNDVDSSHMMNARVIWTTRKGHYSGGYGIGVKFVKNEEVYKQLLGG